MAFDVAISRRSQCLVKMIRLIRYLEDVTNRGTRSHSGQGQEPLVASLLLGAPSSFLFLVERPGAPSSVLAPSSTFSIF